VIPQKFSTVGVGIRVKGYACAIFNILFEIS